MDYYSFTGPEGWEAELALPTKWSHVNYRSRKVRKPETDVLTSEPRRQGEYRPHQATLASSGGFKGGGGRPPLLAQNFFQKAAFFCVKGI